MKESKAKEIIRNLLDAMRDADLASMQDGGKHVDIVFSQKPGKSAQVMLLDEAEELLDKAIRDAWREMFGKEIVGDPVEFINDNA